LTPSHTKTCDDAGIAAMVPKSLTFGARADGLFDEQRLPELPDQKPMHAI
jgi:hypothetical protein